MAGLMRRIFGAGQRSKVLSLRDYLMHYAGGMLLGEDFVNDEGTLPLGLEFVLFLLRQA